MRFAHAPKEKVGKPIKDCVDVFAARKSLFGLLRKNSQKYKKYQRLPNGVALAANWRGVSLYAGEIRLALWFAILKIFRRLVNR